MDSEEIVFLVREDLRQCLTPYLERAGAPGLGKFFLKAINFDRRCRRWKKLDTTLCHTGQNIIVAIDSAGNRVISHKVTLQFRDEAGRMMAAVKSGKSPQQVCNWLEARVNAYGQFLDGGPALNTLSRQRLRVLAQG